MATPQNNRASESGQPHEVPGICSAAGCSTNAQARGLCKKHGANGIYSVADCSANVNARGLCAKHGTNSTSRQQALELFRKRKKTKPSLWHPSAKKEAQTHELAEVKGIGGIIHLYQHGWSEEYIRQYTRQLYQHG